MYSGTPLFGHPLNADTPILRTVLFVPTTSSCISLKNNPLITDTRYYGQRTLFRVLSDKLLYNRALRTLFTCIGLCLKLMTRFLLWQPFSSWHRSTCFCLFERSKIFMFVWANAMTDTRGRNLIYISPVKN